MRASPKILSESTAVDINIKIFCIDFGICAGPNHDPALGMSIDCRRVDWVFGGPFVELPCVFSFWDVVISKTSLLYGGSVLHHEGRSRDRLGAGHLVRHRETKRWHHRDRFSCWSGDRRERLSPDHESATGPMRDMRASPIQRREDTNACSTSRMRKIARAFNRQKSFGGGELRKSR